MKGSRPGSAPGYASGNSLLAAGGRNSLMGSQSGPFLAQKGFASSRPATQPLTQGYTMSQSQATGKN